jgi:DNA-binding LacI/PurR family transcriptional regulator
MADVANLAGVSNQTISRVANGTGYVAPRTRERVLAAMRELGYHPNPAARALVTGRSRAVGVIAMEAADFAPASILLGFERAAREHGYLSIVSRLPRLDRHAVTAAIDELKRHRVEGIVLHTGLRQVPPAVIQFARTTPTVTVVDLSAAAMWTAAVDQFAGAQRATRLLLDLGHRSIAHVAGPQDSLLARQRQDAWHSVLAAAGIAAPDPLEGDWSARSGYELGRRIAADETVTAIFAANDAMAIGVLRALHVAGRRVPDDVSVVGFDDIPEVRYLTPPLTTVRQDFDEVGRESFGLLLAAIGGDPAEPLKLTFTPELIVRESTSVAKTN